MFYLPDILVLCGLFLDGFFLGFYCKYAYVYGNLWIHWYTLVGMGVSLVLASIWTYKKYQQRQYRFDHFYMIFYGLICYMISACFMLLRNLEISLYFGFIGHAILFLPCYSYISLRSSSKGSRPVRVALGNLLYFAGLTSGFAIFNVLEIRESGWTYLVIVLSLLVATVTNEVLQHLGIYNYKLSNDVVFNLMNEEKSVFLSTKSIYALFVSRNDFYITKNRQILIVALISLLLLERSLLYSTTFMELSWSASVGFTGAQHMAAPFLFYAIGAVFGSALMTRYKPKLVFLMFGLIKITAIGAILGVYTEYSPENCLLFLGFYYVAMGVYSSVVLHGFLECAPFICTELIMSGAYVLELCMLEVLKYENKVNDVWSMLLGIGIAMTFLTALCIVLVQLYLPNSEGLIDIRNRLLGIRRHKPVVSQSKIWNANTFLQHDVQPNEVTCITLEGNRVFQQYPRNIEKRTRF